MSAPRMSFPRARRISGQGAFKRIMDARARVEFAALLIHAAPNALANSRLGISIGKRIGTAARRNRVKRLLREAFRLTQGLHPTESPGPYDVIVVVRPHEELPLAEYQRLLLEALGRLDQLWRKRAARGGPG